MCHVNYFFFKLTTGDLVSYIDCAKVIKTYISNYKIKYLCDNI